jgi:GDP-4-dehydro-6-deoxy-D-mannose reductase
MPKRLLITGATGFVGIWTSRHFKTARNGIELWATSNEPAPVQLQADKFVQINLCDSEAVRDLIAKCRPDEVIHLAGLIGNASLAELMRVNVIGTENLYTSLIEKCDINKLRVVQAGSAASYGMVYPDELPIIERQEPRPVSPYAISKLTQDYLAMSMWLRNGLQVICGRIFNLLGPGQPKSLVPMAFVERLKDVKKGLTDEFSVGNTDSRRDFVDVRDVASAFDELLQKAQPGQLYNIASGNNVSIQQIIDKLLQISGVRAKVISQPALQRPTDVPCVRADISKISKATGWSPKILLDESLETMWRQSQD